MSMFEKRVEAAAEGMWDRYGDRGMFTHAPEHMREAFKTDARAALEAADAVVTEEQIAVTICAYLGHTGGIECEGDIDAARAILTLFHGGAK